MEDRPLVHQRLVHLVESGPEVLPAPALVDVVPQHEGQRDRQPEHLIAHRALAGIAGAGVADEGQAELRRLAAQRRRGQDDQDEGGGRAEAATH